MGMAAGLILGILSGLGLGGGSLLVIWLTLGKSMEGSIAREISLLFFFPASLISIFLQRGKHREHSLLPAQISGAAAALGFSFLARVWDPGHFQKAMGILLIFLGIGQVFHRRMD